MWFALPFIHRQSAVREPAFAERVASCRCGRHRTALVALRSLRLAFDLFDLFAAAHAVPGEILRRLKLRNHRRPQVAVRRGSRDDEAIRTGAFHIGMDEQPQVALCVPVQSALACTVPGRDAAKQPAHAILTHTILVATRTACATLLVARGLQVGEANFGGPLLPRVLPESEDGTEGRCRARPLHRYRRFPRGNANLPLPRARLPLVVITLVLHGDEYARGGPYLAALHA